LAAAAVGTIALVGATSSFIAATAQGASAATRDKKAVQIVSRNISGETAPVTMLATLKGASLYTPPASGCTGGCLTVWPALYVAKGYTPTGVAGLGEIAVTVGNKHRLQVTYLGNRLYTFTGDSGSTVNGNGVAGFMAAVVGG